MPNHITNRIEFSGKPENIEKVFEIIGSEERIIDFEKLVPMPPTLYLPSGDESPAVQYALSKKSEADKHEIETALKKRSCSYYGNYFDKWFCRVLTETELQNRADYFVEKLSANTKPAFDDTPYQELGINTYEDLGDAYIRNVRMYGYDTWYDWRCDKWGTKWNAYDIFRDGDSVEFDTAWSCPLPILDQLAKLCHEYKVSFTGKWADEDVGHNVGIFESDCNGNEYWFSYEYINNESNEVYDIYVELKGETNCLGKDKDGNWVRYDCDNCPNKDIC